MNFKAQSADDNKDSLNDDSKIINKCPAVKLLDNRNATLAARVNLPIISIKGKKRLNKRGMVHVTLFATV